MAEKISRIIVEDPHGNSVDREISTSEREIVMAEHNADATAHEPIRNALNQAIAQAAQGSATALSNHDIAPDAHSDIRDLANSKVADVQVGETSVVENGVAHIDPDDFGKVDDVQVDGQSVVTGKVANIDSSNFGKVDDVQVDGQSVVSNKVADFHIPTSISELSDADDYATKEDAQAMVDEAKVTSVTLEYEENEGAPNASVNFNDGNVHFTLQNMKMKFSDLEPEEIEQITGPEGKQGALAVYDSSQQYPPFEFDTKVGQSNGKGMTQKAITDELVNVGKKMGEYDTDYAYGLALVDCSIPGGTSETWDYNATVKQKHMALPVAPGERLLVKPSSDDLQTGWCAWVTSAYGGTTPQHGAAIPYVDGTTLMTLPKNEENFLVVPSGAAYFIMNCKNGNSKTTSWQVFKQDEKNISEEIADINGKVFDESKASVKIQPYTIIKGKLINADGSIAAAANNNYKIHYLQVYAGDKYLIELSYTSSGARRIYQYPNVPNVGVQPSARFCDELTASLSKEIEITSDGYLAVYSNYTDANVGLFNLGINKVETIAEVVRAIPNQVRLTPQAASGFIKPDGTFASTSSGIYDCTDYVEVQSGDLLVYTGSVGSAGIAIGAYTASKNFIEALLPDGDYKEEEVPITFNGYIRACSRNGANGPQYRMIVIHHKIDKSGAYDYIKQDIHNMSWLNGKTVAIMGDSISTNGNDGNDMNTPEMRIEAEDVGVELSAYLSYRDVNNQHLSLGGHTFTSNEIGTEVTFTPVEADVTKVIGQPANYNANSVTTWWELASQALGFTPIPVCWSGSSITSHEKNAASAKTSWAWHPSQIRRCGIRTPGTMERTAPDVIIIYRGTNDMTHEPYTRLTEGCFGGADYTVASDDEISSEVYGFKEGYALTIKKLREAYPFAHIILCTLNVFKRINYAQFPTNNGINSLPEYNNAIREVADYFGCGLIEFDKDGITFENCYPTYIDDSATIPTHPNDAGHRMMGRKAIADLKKHFDNV